MSRRAGLGVAILVLWVGVLAWHVQREYFIPDLVRMAQATLDLAPGTHYYAIEMQGTVIGTASSQLDTLPDGFRIDDMMILEASAMGQPGEAIMRTQVTLTRALRMRDFSFRLQSEAGDFTARGHLEGDTLLQVEVEAAGAAPETLAFPVAEPPVFSAALPLLVVRSGEPRVGRRMTVSVFDPSTLSTRPVEVEILEVGTVSVADSAVYHRDRDLWEAGPTREVAAWRIRESFGGLVTESWIDEEGRVIRASSPMGFTMERMHYDLARQARAQRPGAGPDGDIIFNTAIASNRTLDDLEARDRVRFRLSGTAFGDFDLDGGRQTFDGEILEVQREVLAELEPGFTLPWSDDGFEDELGAEPLVQSEDPRIVAAAESILGGDPRGMDPVEAATRINDAVFEMLEKEITFTIPSAVQALETRLGDCMEHTALYLALARAAGLPARAAVGLVYLEDRFFYHAWPEVWLGEWVAMEPTFGQAPADAAHLRFVTGSLARQIEIAALIGTLGIEVLEEER